MYPERAPEGCLQSCLKGAKGVFPGESWKGLGGHSLLCAAWRGRAWGRASLSAPAFLTESCRCLVVFVA